MIIILILIGVVALILIYGVTVYNKLIRLREAVRNAFSQIDVQLERRYDLIPNLLEVAKKYMKHERETLEAVVDARSKATSARIEVNGDPANTEALKNLAGADTQLNSSLARLMAVVEAYPDLKADQTMEQLSEELTTTENKIAFSRQNYNDQVNSYQVYKTSYPPAIFAETFKFRDASYLELDEEPEKRENIKINFDDPQ